MESHRDVKGGSLREPVLFYSWFNLVEVITEKFSLYLCPVLSHGSAEKHENFEVKLPD
jgi:hypothetical protein